jgi:hypothetical protein
LIYIHPLPAISCELHTPNKHNQEYIDGAMTHYIPHCDPVANEHQASLTLNRCHQEEKENKIVHTKHDKHKP